MQETPVGFLVVVYRPGDVVIAAKRTQRMSVLTSKLFGRWASSPFQGLRRPAQPEYSLRESLGELDIRFQQGRGGRTTLGGG